MSGIALLKLHLQNAGAKPRGNALGNVMVRDVVGYYGAGANQCASSNGHSGENHRPPPDRGTAFHACGHGVPALFGLQTAFGRPPSDECVSLNLDDGSNLGVVPKRAAVEIHQFRLENLDSLTQDNIGRNWHEDYCIRRLPVKEMRGALNDDRGARAWLYGKLLVTLLAQNWPDWAR